MTRLATLFPKGPTRTLAASSLVNTAGNGLFMTVGVLYFTRIVGLSPAQVGLGLTIAGFFGLLVGVPAGQLADRRGPRELLLVLVTLEGVGTIGYLVVRGMVGFVVAACVVTVLDRAAAAVRNTVTAGLGDPSQRVRTRALLRSVTNVGISLGAMAGAVALQIDTPLAYRTLIAADVATFVVAALLLRPLPHLPPSPHAGEGPRLAVLRDRPYLAVTALGSAVSVNYTVLEVVMPLWVAERTHAPRWVVGLLFLVNTVTVAFAQVRLSRGSEDVPTAARYSRRAGLLVAACCLLSALAAGPSAPVAVALLLGAAAAQVVGEMYGAAGGWGLSMELAPQHAMGQYVGFTSTGQAAAGMLAPALLAVACLQWGRPGWLLVAAFFVVVGVATVPVARWAEADRARRVQGAA